MSDTITVNTSTTNITLSVFSQPNNINVNVVEAGAIWGSINGTITNQADLINYIGSVSSSFATNTTVKVLTGLLVKTADLNTLSATLLTRTDANTLTSLLVTNTAFSSYQTNIANTTATLLPTSVYQSASSSFATTLSLSATTLKVYDKAVTYTVALSDNNSAIHLDTTSASISALFPSNLTEGFSVALMNTGTNYLYLSSALPLVSLGNSLSGKGSGAFTYVHSGNLYAVGRF
jgi:hypothetical protein